MRNGLREIIIEKEPFTEFEFVCPECGAVLIEFDDWQHREHRYNESLVTYRLGEHAKETGHDKFRGVIEPTYTPKSIDVTITVDEEFK